MVQAAVHSAQIRDALDDGGNRRPRSGVERSESPTVWYPDVEVDMSRRMLLLLTVATLCLLLPVSTAAQHASPHDLLILQNRSGTTATALVVQRGSASRRLPAGLYSPRTHLMFVATTAPDRMHTNLRSVAVESGRARHTLTLAGQFSTDPLDYSGAALSFNGRWLALRSLSTTATNTTIAVIDTTTMRLVARPLLAGHYGLDAIDANGSVLYLIEHLPPRGSDIYQVRSYNLQTRALDASPVLEKGETVGTMSGVAHTRAWSAGGDWLFTLYVRPGTAGAFIHSLGLEYRLAHCIFLPDKGIAAEQLAQFALVVAPGGEALYAVNPGLGRITAVSGGGSTNLPFGTMTNRTWAIHASFQQNASSATVSRDGRTLFVATSRGLWVIKTTTLTLQTTYVPGEVTSSVALSSDGNRLYVLQPTHHRVAVLSSKTGSMLATMPAPVSMSSIEHVLH